MAPITDHNIAAANEDQEDRLTVGAFIQIVKDRSRVVWGSIAFFVAIAVLLLIIKPPLYTITMIVAPAPSTSNKASSTSSALSSISGLIGGSTTASTSTPLAPMDEFLQLIISPRVAQTLIAKNPAVLQTIFPKEWDPVTKTWHPPHDILSTFGRAVFELFGLPAWSKPSAQRLSDYLTTNLTIAEVNTTAMQEITYNFKDPKFAVWLLKNLQIEGDKIIRVEAETLADKQIDYLQKKLDETTAVDYRQTLLGLLGQQVTTRMSINANLPYAAMVVQPAVSSDLPTSPNPFIWLGIGAVVGALFGIFAALGSALIWPDGVPELPLIGRLLRAFRKGGEYLTNSAGRHIRSNAE